MRHFFFAVAVACVFGLGIRLYLHPARIKALVEQALGPKAAEIGLKFESARLSLSNGALPRLAVEVERLEANPAHLCQAEASIRVARLVMPISFSSLLAGRLALGTVTSEDMQIDLDALKTQCQPRAPSASSASARATPGASASSAAPQAITAEATRWWRAEDLEAARGILDGVEFSRVTVLFENATKKVYLESFALEPLAGADALQVSTDLTIPPELTYGERLPSLKIEAKVFPTAADVKVSAGLSEGRMDVAGRLNAAPGGLLDADLQAAVGDVPLSTLVPLISKSGVIKGEFRPRFMWMNCQASIRGRFQGLFAENPLKLENCRIEGNGAQIQVAEALRRASGDWAPFKVKMSNVDVGQILQTFGWKGPDGIIADFGRIDGELQWAEDERALLDIESRGAQIRFSNHNIRADQRVNRLRTKIVWGADQVAGTIEQIEVDGGQFQGAIGFSYDPNSKGGRVQAKVDGLRFNEAVQKVLVGGQFEKLDGGLEAKFADGRLTALKGEATLANLSGKELRAAGVSAKFEPRSGSGKVRVQLRGNGLLVHRDSVVFQALKPVFFSHDFSDEWIAVDESLLRLEFGSEGDWRWELAQGEVAGSQIRVQSSGTRSKERALDGWVRVDFPAVRKLKWKFSGSTDSLPNLRWTPDSRALEELLKEEKIVDQRLGLEVADNSSLSAAGVAKKAKENLRMIRDKVIRGAKTMIQDHDQDQARDQSPPTAGQ